MIFHALDVLSIIFATSYVEVKTRRSRGCRTVCFGYVHVLPEVRKSSKTIKVVLLLLIEQLILYLAQLNPGCFDTKSYSIPIKRNDIDNQLFTLTDLLQLR